MTSIPRTAKRFPFFIDTYGGFFQGASFGTPSGIANFTSPAGCGQLHVTGAAGASTLSVDTVDVGALADYGGEFGVTIQHDDGTYGLYSCLNVNTGASTIGLFPRLAKAVTNGLLGNTYNSVNGQHLSTLGYIALGHYVAGLQKRDGWIQRRAGGLVFTSSGLQFGASMVLAGGLTTGSVVAGTAIAKGLFQPMNLNVNGITTNAVRTTLPDHGAVFGVGSRSVAINAGTAGNGATHTAALGGRSGMLEVFVSVRGEFSGTMASRAKVVVTIDGVDVQTTYISHMTRITQPFTHATTGVLTVTLETSAPTTIAVGPISWWCWPDSDWGSVDPAASLFEPGARVALYCDSWGVINSNAFQTGLEQALGASLTVNASVSGTTAAQALASYDTLVDPYRPDYVIVDYQINDRTAGLNDMAMTQKQRLLVQHILRRGATPVYLRTLMTAAIGQLQALVNTSKMLLATWPVGHP